MTKLVKSLGIGSGYQISYQLYDERFISSILVNIESENRSYVSKLLFLTAETHALKLSQKMKFLTIFSRLLVMKLGAIFNQEFCSYIFARQDLTCNLIKKISGKEISI